MNTTKTTATLALLACLAGCSTHTSPALSVTDLTVGQRGDQAVVLLFTLDAENANSVPLPLREVRYRFALDGREVFAGRRSAQATLRRFGTQQVRLPVVIPLADMPDHPADYQLTGKLVYIAPGEIAQILFDTGVRRPSTTFKHHGSLDPNQTNAN
jgi:hypothetical protein